MKRIYYTVEEANQILTRIKPLLKELISYNYQIILQSQTSIRYEDHFKDYSKSIKESKHWHKIHYKLYRTVNEIAELGIFVKDPRIGLIDFYTKHQNREIFLCYRYPEEKIKFWHEINSGYSGRKSVKLLEQN